MSEGKSKGVAAILAALPIVGWGGGSMYYVGATGRGIAMTVLSITLIGLCVTMPWAWLSAFALVLTILFGVAPFMYPDDVKWLPTTHADRVVAWIIVAVYVIGIIAGMLRSVTQKDDFKPPPKDSVCDAEGCRQN